MALCRYCGTEASDSDKTCRTCSQPLLTRAVQETPKSLEIPKTSPPILPVKVQSKSHTKLILIAGLFVIGITVTLAWQLSSVGDSPNKSVFSGHQNPPAAPPAARAITSATTHQALEMQTEPPKPEPPKSEETVSEVRSGIGTGESGGIGSGSGGGLDVDALEYTGARDRSAASNSGDIPSNTDSQLAVPKPFTARSTAPSTSAVHLVPPQPMTVLLPPGTTIEVQTIDPINSGSNQTGGVVRGSLAAPIMANNEVLIPGGTTIYLRLLHVRAVGHKKGMSEVRVVLDRLAFQDRSYVLGSTSYDVFSTSSGKESAIERRTRISFQLLNTVSITYVPGTTSSSR